MTDRGRDALKHGSRLFARRLLGGAWLDAAFLMVLGIVLAAIGWRRWADLHVDFGQQLYVPWRLSEGEVLYGDIAYLHGPLSPYLNSVLFRLFGASYTTLIVANLASVGAMCGVLYRTFRDDLDRVAALTVCTVFLTVFAFGQYVGVGNYNWMSPYAHSTTHSLLLFALLMLALPDADVASGRRWIGVGVILGCLLVTRVETAVAAIAAIGISLLTAPDSAGRPGRAARNGARVAFGAALPVLAAIALFVPSLGVEQGVAAVTGPWRILLSSGLPATPFFLRSSGLDDVGLSIQVTAVAGLSALSLLAILTAAAVSLRSSTTSRPLRLLVAIGQLAVGVFAAATIYVGDVGRALPIVILLPIAVWAYDLPRADRDRASAPRLLAWAVFGLVLLGKMILNARLHQYGFYLGMGATLVVCAFLVTDLPRRVTAAGGSGRLLRGTILVMLVVVAGRLVNESRSRYAMKTLEFGSGGDRIVTYGRDRDVRVEAFAEALAFLEALPDGATVQVLPEGVMLNYLTRRPAPSKFTNFMPTEVTVFGEASMLADLREARPDYIVVIHKGTAEYGLPYFGTDDRYGREIMTWVRGAYDRVLLAGVEPLRSGGFGVEILGRVDGPASESRIPGN